MFVFFLRWCCLEAIWHVWLSCWFDNNYGRGKREKINMAEYETAKKQAQVYKHLSLCIKGKSIAYVCVVAKSCLFLFVMVCSDLMGMLRDSVYTCCKVCYPGSKNSICRSSLPVNCTYLVASTWRISCDRPTCILIWEV